MSVQNLGPSAPKHDFDNINSSHLAEISSVLLEVDKKKVNIKKGRIDKVAYGMAEIAFSLGQTNNPDLFAADLAEDIFEALKKVKKRQEKRKKEENR